MIPDPDVKEYIDQFDPDFRDILLHLRALIYQVVPDATEDIKYLKFKSIDELDEDRLRLWILESFYT